METLKISKKGLKDFNTAQSIAWEAASEKLGEDLILWSWYDAETGNKSPTVVCDEDDRNAIELYAETRGGKLKVLLEEGRYEFCFGPNPM